MLPWKEIDAVLGAGHTEHAWCSNPSSAEWHSLVPDPANSLTETRWSSDYRADASLTATIFPCGSTGALQAAYVLIVTGAAGA